MLPLLQSRAQLLLAQAGAERLLRCISSMYCMSAAEMPSETQSCTPSLFMPTAMAKTRSQLVCALVHAGHGLLAAPSFG